MNFAAFTNKKLVKRYNLLNAESSKMVTTFINTGYGHVRPSQMRERINEHPLFAVYLGLLDEMGQIKDEAKRRYGPDLSYVGQLVHT